MSVVGEEVRRTASASLPASLVVATRALLALNAATWIIFGSLVASGWIGVGIDDQRATLFLASLMWGNGIVLAVFAWATLRGRTFIDWIALGVVVINLALTLTDEVGIYDWIVFGINIASVVTLALAIVLLRRARRTELAGENAGEVQEGGS